MQFETTPKYVVRGAGLVCTSSVVFVTWSVYGTEYHTRGSSNSLYVPCSLLFATLSHMVDVSVMLAYYRLELTFMCTCLRGGWREREVVLLQLLR
jgi:hypothetical protein